MHLRLLLTGKHSYTSQYLGYLVQSREERTSAGVPYLPLQSLHYHNAFYYYNTWLSSKSHIHKARIGKLRPVGQIWPAAYFCTAHELKMVFIFLNSWKTSKEDYFMTREKYMKIAFMSINKILLEQSHTHSLTCCLWLLSCYNGRVQYLQQRPYGLQSLKYSLSCPSQKKFANLWYRGYYQGSCSEFKEAQILSDLVGQVSSEGEKD